MGIELVVFDLVDTLVDCGSMAAVQPLSHTFAAAGVPAKREAVRASVGRTWRDQLTGILSLPRVVRAWPQAHGQPGESPDLDQLLRACEPPMRRAVLARAQLIPDAAEALRWLGSRGIRVAVTGNWPRLIGHSVLERAGASGLEPDHAGFTEDVAEGTPPPNMISHAMNAYGLSNSERVVKIGSGPVRARQELPHMEHVDPPHRRRGQHRRRPARRLSDERRMALHEELQAQHAEAHVSIATLGALEQAIAELDTHLSRGDSPSSEDAGAAAG